MPKRQAVLLIHGIGEQRPMDTLRRFVETAWTTHTDIHHKHAGAAVWSKPDGVSRSFELRRLTTPQNAGKIETHFYEFYWAHLMEGTSYGHVWAWTRSLLLRWPASVPSHLLRVYVFLWILLLAAAALLTHALCAMGERQVDLPTWVSLASSGLIMPFLAFIVLRVIGDAARYLHVAAANVQRRHEIRQLGVNLLKELHAPARRYDRIIVVGHSLGSVIGYDVLTHAWIDFHKQHDASAREMAALRALEAMARDPEADAAGIPAGQRAYFEELKANGNSWRVTDFITLGSPLAHAGILLAQDEKGLAKKQEDREFPRCLPQLETVMRKKQPVQRFAYESVQGDEDSLRVPHHAAVFGPTRWTNLYFPEHFLVWGDPVGGPLRPAMGTGVRDVAVTTTHRLGFLAHTLYWMGPPGDDKRDSVRQLRAALDLTDGPVVANHDGDDDDA